MIFTPKEDCLQFVEFEIAKMSVRLSTEDTNDRQVKYYVSKKSYFMNYTNGHDLLDIM